MTETSTLERPRLDDGTTTDSNRVAHFCKKVQITDAYVYGQGLEALCGERFIPEPRPAEPAGVPAVQGAHRADEGGRAMTSPTLMFTGPCDREDCRGTAQWEARVPTAADPSTSSVRWCPRCGAVPRAITSAPSVTPAAVAPTAIQPQPYTPGYGASLALRAISRVFGRTA